jgi:hypothetical protein
VPARRWRMPVRREGVSGHRLDMVAGVAAT